MKNLILSGGIFHPFDETSASIARHLEAEGISSRIAGVAEGFRLLGDEAFDLVTVNALSWSMTQADKYEPFRAAFAFDPPPDAREAMARHLERGGGLLGLHTAAICFDTWPEWPAMLGAGWVWGQSHHPAPGYVNVDTGTRQFRIWDELYCAMVLAPETAVLATATSADVETAQPVMTASGRRVYLALGHDLTATENAGYRDLLLRGARIATGREQER